MIRYLGAALSSLVMFLWIASATLQWEHFGARSKRITVALCLLFLTISYGFIEAAMRGVPIGPRTFATCGALALLSAALLYRFSDKP